MAKNLVLVPILAHFCPNLVAQIFFRWFYLYQMLEIVASYHCMHFQGKLLNQTWENCKKPNFGPNSGLFGQNFDHQFFFFSSSKIWLCQSLDIMASYHHVHYQTKNNDPILRKFSDRWTDRWMDRRMDRCKRVIS